MCTKYLDSQFRTGNLNVGFSIYMPSQSNMPYVSVVGMVDSLAAS